MTSENYLIALAIEKIDEKEKILILVLKIKKMRRGDKKTQKKFLISFLVRKFFFS